MNNRPNATATTATGGYVRVNSVPYAATVATNGIHISEFLYWREEFDQVLTPRLLGRITAEEKSRKAMLDRQSRARPRTDHAMRKSTRRLQTCQAAMDARFAAGCCR